MQVLDSPDTPDYYRHSEPVYASFGDRLLATLVDAVVLAILFSVAWLFTLGLVSRVLGYVGFSLLYYALFESSQGQATPGKRVAGIIVTDLDGNRINLVQGVGRYLVRIVSYTLFFIGVFLMFFTERRQTLHDLVTGTVVVKK